MKRLFISSLAPLLYTLSLSCAAVFAGESPPLPGAAAGRSTASIHISRPDPDARGGKAYRLVYQVPVPIDILWKFKTDFDNEFLLGNKYIQSHRLVSRRDNTVITEDRYSQQPALEFTWETTLSANRRRLDFRLLNARQAGQKFHYGHILLEPRGATTRVTQVAFFDFLGASLWAAYPWGGGMHDFLRYSARWEQDMAVQRMPLYRTATTP